jgi:hypothetical protein
LNRHCPKCGSKARDRWLEKQAEELLPVAYSHVIITLPHELIPLALQNPRVVYSIFFRAVSQALLAIAEDPRHLGARLGFLAVLHTWNQKLQAHPHIHCVVPAGGIAFDQTRWIAAAVRSTSSQRRHWPLSSAENSSLCCVVLIVAANFNSEEQSRRFRCAKHSIDLPGHSKTESG